MNLHPDDPRLSAWVLGELPADEADAVASAVAADPQLQAAVTELQGVCDFLGGTFAAPSLRPEQREAVRQAGRSTVIEFPAPKKKAGFQQWHALLATAAVITLGVFLASQMGQERGADSGMAKLSPPEAGDAPSIRPTVGKGDAQGGSRHVHGIDDASSTALADFSHVKLPDAAKLPATPMNQAADIDLPLVVGRSSYDWVRGWIQEKNQLPPKEAVRIEELANAFPLPPEEETESFAGLKVACVSMPSRLTGEGRLVGVQIANESNQARRVSWAFRPAAGSRGGLVRVLASTGGAASVPSTLPAGNRTLVLIELTSAAGEEVGDLVVAADGRSRRIPAVETKAPSLEQAGLVAAFGIWLRGEGVDDTRLRRILVAAEENPDPRSAEIRQLVGKALDIASSGR
ncbi:von Willebrand factor type A domain-containing protein [Luteolibacter flavescens]|uniref:von Willebrand factor type A domain-containing protein n=1 Tax=Luteolibacter flavescens TaxID=1859460 RepID=A0ABT3FQY2_9BACT|nr:von Willebrand factor type A domain-containing protein [Luteolibacter flavescens]MCW1885983.1 von Willebrand factor type A domain-containing protein [Luteolibacter flavescens]